MANFFLCCSTTNRSSWYSASTASSPLPAENFVGTSRRSITSLERGPTKSETAVAAVIVGSEGFFISNSSTFRFPIFAAMMSRVSLGRPSSKMVRAISSSVRYQVCLLRTLVAERETFLSTALKESARL